MNRGRWLAFEQLDSTSLHARREILAGRMSRNDGAAVIVAAEQFGGVGRFGRAWSSPVGGLWMTLAWPIDGEPAALLDGLGLRIGMALLDVVRSLVPERARASVRLKWPNDVEIDDRKVGGALTELIRDDRREYWLLVGIGLNANFPLRDLPELLRDRATTLLEHRVCIDRADTALTLANALVPVLSSPGLSETELARARTELESAAPVAPGLVSLPNGEKVHAVLEDLDALGHAVFRTPDGRRFTSTAAPSAADP